MNNHIFTYQDWLAGNAVKVNGDDDSTWWMRGDESLSGVDLISDSEYQKVINLQKKCYNLVKYDRLKYHLEILQRDIHSALDKEDYLNGRRRELEKSLDEASSTITRRVRAGDWEREGFTSQRCKMILEGPKAFRGIPGTERLPGPKKESLVLKYAIKYELLIEVKSLILELEKKKEEIKNKNDSDFWEAKPSFWGFKVDLKKLFKKYIN